LSKSKNTRFHSDYNEFYKNNYKEEKISSNNYGQFKKSEEHCKTDFVNEGNSKSNKNLLDLNKKINIDIKRNSFSYHNQNIDKLNKKEMLNLIDKRNYTKSHKENLSDRKKKFKQKKEKEKITIQNQVDKIDSIKSLINGKIDINILYDINQYNKANNIGNSNYFRKVKLNTSSNSYNFGKLNRLKEEYKKKYIFRPELMIIIKLI